MTRWVSIFVSILMAVSCQTGVLRADGDYTLKVLSFNINGLPAPLKTGKKPLYERIAEILKERRANNTQPQVVVLQEAFDGDTRIIAREAGYPYVLFGPGRTDTSKRGSVHWAIKTRKSYTSVTDPQKFMGSGLVILSDFPIVEARHKAFNSDECAGLDCLSNKSILLARVDVPWCDEPLDIITGHLNSFRSAKAPKRLVQKAFEKQTNVLSWFLEKTDKGNPVILAGDFNTRAEERYQFFRSDIPLTDVGEFCVLAGDCTLDKNLKDSDVWLGTNDKQFYKDSKTFTLKPRFISRPFDETLDGKPLSDHRGYEVHYTFAMAAPYSLKESEE